jgi:ubiquinone/menaquinone biosynthesis C-methylase UbiE
MNWLDFWNGSHSIYVCDKHRHCHHARISADIIDRLHGPTGLVIDYGCGEALFAQTVAKYCRKLILSDGAPKIRQLLKERYQEASNISVLSPDDVLALDRGSVDCMIIHSVLQYVPQADAETLLGSLADLLAPSGRLIIGDIIPPDHTIFADAGALLALAWQEQFMTKAVIGLVRTFLSDYRKIRADHGLTCYAQSELEQMCERLGLTIKRTPLNIGFDQGRMTFELRKPAL